MATHSSVFLPGESHGLRSLAGGSSWDRKESDMTERLTHTWVPGPLHAGAVPARPW